MTKIHTDGRNLKKRYQYTCGRCNSIVDYDGYDLVYGIGLNGEFVYCPVCKGSIAWETIAEEGTELEKPISVITAEKADYEKGYEEVGDIIKLVTDFRVGFRDALDRGTPRSVSECLRIGKLKRVYLERIK